MKTAPELDVLLVGAVLSAPDVPRAKRLVATLGDAGPATLVDPLARTTWAIILDHLSRDEHPTAATVFSDGAMRHGFNPKDAEQLRAWETGSAVTEAEVVAIAAQIRRYASQRRIGTSLQNLGAAVAKGLNKNGQPFGPDDALPYFDAIHRDYRQLHARGLVGSDAVVLSRAAYETRKKEGKPNVTRTGLPIIDKEIGGMPLKLVWLLAPGGIGKSTVLGTMFDLHQALGLTAVLASMEDNHEWPVHRHMALRTKMKLKEVYNLPFPDEEAAHAAEQELFERWRNLRIITKQHARNLDDVLRLWVQYIVQDGASVFYLDNMSALERKFRGASDTTHAAAGRDVEKLAEFADTWKVTVIAAAHTNNAYWERTKGRSPAEIKDTADTGGGAAADRFVRQGWSVWQKGEELRMTCTKNTVRSKDVGRTFAFDAFIDYGLMDVDSGREVNLAAEYRARKEAEEAAALARDDAKAKRNRDRNRAWAIEERAAKAKLAAEAKAKEPAQAALFAAPTPKERE